MCGGERFSGRVLRPPCPSAPAPSPAEAPYLRLPRVDWLVPRPWSDACLVPPPRYFKKTEHNKQDSLKKESLLFKSEMGEPGGNDGGVRLDRIYRDPGESWLHGGGSWARGGLLPSPVAGFRGFREGAC